MTWSDFFLPAGAQTFDEAEANLAAQKVKLEQIANDRETWDYYAGIDPATDTSLQLDRGALAGHLEDQNAAAYAGFKEGLADGAKNVKEAFTGFGLFKLVPIWLWIVAGLVVFFWIGGAGWSKGRLNR